MVRSKESGDILYLTSFEGLHQWIMEQRVGKLDEISRTGKKWMKLGDIGEFMPVFQVVESISSIASMNAPPEAIEQIPIPKAPTLDEPRPRVPTTVQYGQTEESTRRDRPSRMTPPGIESSTEAPEVSTAMGVQLDSRMSQEESDAWSIGGPPLEVAEPSLDSEVSEFQHRLEQRTSLTPILVLASLALIGVGGYLWHFEREMLNEWMSQAPTREVVTITPPDQGHDTTADQDQEPTGHQVVQSALEAAFRAQKDNEAYTWKGVIQATRPSFDNALGVATEEAENWAEGGGIKESLAKARRKLERGHASTARSLFREVLKLEPKNPQALTGLGWASVEMGDYDQAVNQFNRSIQASRKYTDAYIGLGTAELQRGNIQAAYDAYDLYLGRSPKGPKASIARYQMEQLRKQLGL